MKKSKYPKKVTVYVSDKDDEIIQGISRDWNISYSSVIRYLIDRGYTDILKEDSVGENQS